MAMTVAHNSASAMALGELNKNNNKLAKDLKKVSSGMRINGAGDGGAEYAISEKMRVMIRSLGQDTDNSKKGIDLVKVAEGGIQNIIDELREMKAMALNSANAHNTDIDRATIQKEFASRIEEINDIASTTNYNDIILLDGRWGRYIKQGESGGTKLNLISKTVDSNVVTTDGVVQTFAPVTTIRTVPLIKKTDTDTKKEIVDTAPAEGETTTTSANTVQSTSTKIEGPDIKKVSEEKKVNEPNVTTEDNITTIVNTERTITTKTKTTSEIRTDTTTTTKITTTTMVSVEEIKNDEPEEIIIINNGTSSIDQDGLYEFAPDFSGELTITAKNAQLNGPRSGVTLKNVYIKDNGVDNLYIKNLKIENSQDKSAIAFSLAGKNTLHVLGSNSIKSVYNSDSNYKSIINAGGGLSFVGSGSLSINLNGSQYAAMIGSDAYSACGDISIGQKVKLSIVKNHRGSAGAGIGSGLNGTCGNISIGTESIVYVDMFTSDTAATAIGCGDNFEDENKCGNITIYSGASVDVKTAGGAGIGSSCWYSNCGNIIIYSDAKVKASSISGAGIGTAQNDTTGRKMVSKVGDITIYSYHKGDVIATTRNAKNNIGDADPTNNTNISGNVSLLSTYNHTEGGILDLSELSLGESHDTKYEVTTTTITTTEVRQTITETKTTTVETFDEEEESTITAIYEEIEEKEDDIFVGNPLIIHTGPRANQELRIYINDMRPEALGLKDVAVNPFEKALEALDKLDAALEYALNENTQMGAYQVRLHETIETLTTQHENVISSESVIRDADMAKEMASYTKNNILSQAAQAMLAQANQNSSSVLQLLQ